MHNRRLYFLLPDVSHARDIVGELQSTGLDKKHIHVMAKDGVDLEDLPRATHRQTRDTMHAIGDWLWTINVAVFSVSLILLLWTLTEPSLLSVSMLLIMAATIIGGYFWAQVPDTHIKEFRPEMSHGEILLMIDVPKQHLFKVEEQVHRRHSEAISGGTTWMVDAFGL
jgi:hypothetical protein